MKKSFCSSSLVLWELHTKCISGTSGQQGALSLTVNVCSRCAQGYQIREYTQVIMLIHSITLPLSSHLRAFGGTKISGRLLQPITLSNFVSFVRSNTLISVRKRLKYSNSFKLSGSKVEIAQSKISSTRTLGKQAVSS